MSKKIKKSVLENTIVPDEMEDGNIKRFLESIPNGKKMVILTDFYGIPEAKNWSMEEVNSYFTRNKDQIIEDLINEKEARALIGIDQKTVIDLVKGDQTIDELVDADGSIISGKRAKTNDSEIWTAPQQTTNDYKAGVTQGRRFGAWGGTPYSHGDAAGMGESKVHIGERKMREMVEDLINTKLGKKKNDDIVSNNKPSDINRNEIPDIDELFTDKKKAAVAHHTSELIDSIKNNNLEEEELAMVLNALVKNIDFSQLGNDYKKQIKNRF